MSTYFFRTGNNGLRNIGDVKIQLDQWERNGDIDSWHLHSGDPDAPLEIVTQKLSPELVKHRIRELGIDVDFTTPPDSATRNRGQAPGRP
jgi:hypothetical protein